MTRLMLIRHAATDSMNGHLAGRAAGVHLNAEGKSQARRLAKALQRQAIAAIYSSPQARARETAEILAAQNYVTVTEAAELDEIDYGEWTGRSFDELRSSDLWRAFNSARSCTRIPGGELMLEVQARVISLINRLCRVDSGSTLALVSHADVIRAALAHCLGMPLDLSLRLEVSPASLSIVGVHPYGLQVLCINNLGEVHDGQLS